MNTTATTTSPLTFARFTTFVVRGERLGQELAYVLVQAQVKDVVWAARVAGAVNLSITANEVGKGERDVTMEFLEEWGWA